MVEVADTSATSFDRPSRNLVAWGLWIGFGLVVASLGLRWAGSRAREVSAGAATLPVLAPVPDFSLTGQNGQAVSRTDLRGLVWVADFVFTSCTGPCPELTLRMRSLQKSLRKAGPGVKLVSFSLDPETDTPAVLTRYAERYHADPDRWYGSGSL